MTIMESNFSEYTIRNKVYRFRDFEKIENSNDSYFLGYMSMDGGYQRNKRKTGDYPIMQLTSTDFYIVEGFQKQYNPDNLINYRQPRSSKKVNATNPTAEINFPRGMSNTFKKFGILDYKPDRIMIGIPKKYFSSYILGVMDADGCFVVRHRKDCRTPRLNIHIVSEAIKILENIQRILQVELNISSSIYQRKKSNCFELRINDTDNAIKFGHWIYSNCPDTYNFQKRKIFKNYLELINKL